MKNKLTQVLIASCCIALNASCMAKNTSPESDSLIQVVFFSPKGEALPPKSQKRINEVADITEKFYKKWMKHWGYETEQDLKMNRDKNGNVVINYVEGKYTHESMKYESYSFFKKSVIEQTSQQYNISPKEKFWWAFNYPDKKKKGAYVGGGDNKGGFSRAGFKVVDGDIDVTGPLAANGTADGFLLKAVIHEMGHALGLSHNGPHEKDGYGNSLMGPVNKAYKKIFADERVYLSKASAAMLWKHPIFTGTNKDINKKINFSLKNYQASYDQVKDQIIVNGQLDSDYPAHSVVIADTSNSIKSTYWQKMYVCDIKDGGKFSCIIDEPYRSSGKLQMVFCFNNGAVLGVPKSQRVKGKQKKVWGKALRKGYTFKNNQYSFSS